MQRKKGQKTAPKSTPLAEAKNGKVSNRKNQKSSQTNSKELIQTLKDSAYDYQQKWLQTLIEYEQYKRKIENKEMFEYRKKHEDFMKKIEQTEREKKERIKNSPCGVCTLKKCLFEGRSHFVGQMLCPEYDRISKSYDFRFRESEPVIAIFSMLEMN